MVDAQSRTRPDAGTAKHLLLWLAAVRVVAGGLAIVLAPVLFREHFVVLALLRPSQLVLLAGAFLARQHEVWLPSVLLAAIPLQVLAIWLYFALGRAWQDDLSADEDDELPFLAARLLPRRYVKRLKQVLEAKGARLVFLARFALFPTGMVSAAVGASDLDTRRYLTADIAGVLLSSALSVGAGYGLGVAYGGARPWALAAGIAGLVALTGTLTWLLHRD